MTNKKTSSAPRPRKARRPKAAPTRPDAEVDDFLVWLRVSRKGGRLPQGCTPAEKRAALHQRRLAALAKIDEGHEELEQVEREIDALDRDVTSLKQNVEAEKLEQVEGEVAAVACENAEPEQPAEAVTEEPKTTGECSKYILMERPGTRHSPRDIAVKMYENGWVGPDVNIEVTLQRLRHSLVRLVARDPHFERDESGTTHYYWYVSRPDSDASVPDASINGVSHSAVQGGGK